MLLPTRWSAGEGPIMPCRGLTASPRRARLPVIAGKAGEHDRPHRASSRAGMHSASRGDHADCHDRRGRAALHRLRATRKTARGRFRVFRRHRCRRERPLCATTRYRPNFAPSRGVGSMRRKRPPTAEESGKREETRSGGPRNTEPGVPVCGAGQVGVAARGTHVARGAAPRAAAQNAIRPGGRPRRVR